MLAVSSGPQSGGQPLVALDFPAPLQQRVVNALKADPRTVDLRAQAPQYYSLGAKILDLFEDEELADVLMEVNFLIHFLPSPIAHFLSRRSRSEQLILLIMLITIEVL
jgi:hypothetical protein